jgi:hypothetical protein
MKIAQFLDDDRRIQIHTETAAKLALKEKEKEKKTRPAGRLGEIRFCKDSEYYVFQGGKGKDQST